MSLFGNVLSKYLLKPTSKVADKALDIAMPSIQRDKEIRALVPQMQSAAEESKKANEERYNQLLTGYAQRTSDVDQMNRDVAAGYGAREADVGQMYRDVAGGYGARESDLTRLLDNLGAQSRADIGNQYSAQRAAAEQDLASRGLGNTTVRSSVLSGLGERESAEKRRFDEAMRQQQFGYRRDLSGDTLAAQAAAAQGYGNLSADRLNAQANRASSYAGLTQDPFRVIENRTDIGPGLNDIATLTQSLGQDGLMKLIAQIAAGYATGRGIAG